MKRDQILLDSSVFNTDALRRDLVKVLLRSDIATVEVSLDDDKLVIMASLKKTVLAESGLTNIKKDIVRYMTCKYMGVATFVSAGVSSENNKLTVLCLFELYE